MIHAAKPSLRTIQIASPCSANWEDMAGDERQRFCAQCERTVYNVSAMTRAQANHFLIHTEGQVCTRLYRRADGTVMTADCPFGLRAIRRKVSRIAGAALSTALSLYGTCLAQTRAQATPPEQSAGQPSRSGDRVLSGVILDRSGAVITGAQVTLANVSALETLTLKTDSTGQFRFANLPAGAYRLSVQATGFRTLEETYFLAGLDKKTEAKLTLDVGSMGEMIAVAQTPDTRLPRPHRSPLHWFTKR